MPATVPAAVHRSRPWRTVIHLLVSLGSAGISLPGGGTPSCRLGGGKLTTLIAPTLQMPFTDWLGQ